MSQAPEQQGAAEELARMQALTVPGALDSLSAIGQYVMQAAAEAGIERKRAYQLRLSVDEIVTNIIVHGYQEAGRSGDVGIWAEVRPNALSIVVEDSAVPFDPWSIPEPDSLDKPIEERDIGGLGIYLAIRGVDEFRYEYAGDHNRNILTLHRVAT